MKTIQEMKKSIVPILKRYGVKKAALFGSTVRGMSREGSDVDILVEIESDISLLDFIELKQALEDQLGRKVDLVEYSTIKPLLRERILREQVVIV
nr:nucleotidyltransferase family protein [Candidatus Njordarchaeota archaeon]